ncbi:MAG TPA: cupredoxin domain-containing protein [Candidatus Limnocylindrales bacterium]|jgi:plastocyanin
MKRWIVVVGVIGALLVVGGIAVVALGSGLGESAAGDVAQGPADPGATSVVMNDNFFSPTAVTVTHGSPVQFEIRNDGQVNHNFTSDALHVSTGPVKPGQVVTLTVPIPPGVTQFVCTWHPGMVIQVTGS